MKANRGLFRIIRKSEVIGAEHSEFRDMLESEMVSILEPLGHSV